MNARANASSETATELVLAGVLVVVTVDGVIVGGAAAALTARERAVLDALLERPGAVVSKPALLRQVWAGEEHDEHVVEVTIARLRRRLGPAAAGIETVFRRGYRLAV